jgi:hypothetical protein
MPAFDKTTADNVGVIDFSKYVNLNALLHTSKWPIKLVTLASISEALAVAEKIEAGWRPGDAELSDAPTLYNWRYIDHSARGQGVRLKGICRDHPELLGKRLLTTSHIVAIDLEDLKWCRTLSRFYHLSSFKGD